MASSLPNLVNDLAEEIHRIKCKYEYNNKNLKVVKLNINIATAFLNTH